MDSFLASAFGRDKKRGLDYYRALTDDERYRYVEETGQALRDAVSARLDSLWQMEPADARAQVDKLARQIHAKAKAESR